VTITLTFRRFLKWLGVFLLVLVVGGLTAYGCRAPILTWVGGQLIDVDQDAPADVILVLAGGTPEREMAGADLFKAKMAPIVMLTRPVERPQWDLVRARGIAVESDLEFRRRLVRDLGVPDANVIVLAPFVVSTIAEATAAREWFSGRPLKSVMIVTSAFHTARAKHIFETAFSGMGVTIRMHAAEAGTFRKDNWWQTRANLTDGLIEWQKHLLYQLRFYRGR
jgi:uncharacterized SAM-binding protein YcdF (DUF218 family)